MGPEGRLALLAAVQLHASAALRELDLRANGADPAAYVPVPPRAAPPPGRAGPGARAEAALLAMGQMMAGGEARGEEDPGPLEPGGLTKLEAALAQSLTLARRLQTTRPRLSILM